MSAEAAAHAYNKMFVAYLRTSRAWASSSIPMAAETGPIGGDLSHEFIILAETAESRVFCTRHADAHAVAETRLQPEPEADHRAWTRSYAATDKHEPGRFEHGGAGRHAGDGPGYRDRPIFFFGTKYSEPMGCRVQGADGTWWRADGSYGIACRGCRRHHRGQPRASGIVWPVPVAPFEVALVQPQGGRQDTDAACADLYGKLARAGVSVLYDDTRSGPEPSSRPWTDRATVPAIVGPKA